MEIVNNSNDSSTWSEIRTQVYGKQNETVIKIILNYQEKRYALNCYPHLQ